MSDFADFAKSCALCDEPTIWSVTTWFSSGAVMIGDKEIETGASAPACMKCRERLLFGHERGEHDFMHVVLVP